jgi:hypothetical protein
MCKKRCKIEQIEIKYLKRKLYLKRNNSEISMVLSEALLSIFDERFLRRVKINGKKMCSSSNFIIERISSDLAKNMIRIFKYSFGLSFIHFLRHHLQVFNYIRTTHTKIGGTVNCTKI